MQAIATRNNVHIPERNNILDFGALYFGIIKFSDDKVLIIIYILALKKPHPFFYLFGCLH
jgi:hypothetical protein